MNAIGLAAHRISHGYGPVGALEDVSFAVAAGQRAAFLGPTGCGKSTLLRILAGLIAPAHGRVSFDHRVDSAPPIAYMPQGETLLPWRTALRNATLGAEIAGVDRQEAALQARSLFRRFGLDGFEDSWPDALSGGMRQRVALLRTVLLGQPVLLLDEPFSGLDAITRSDLQGWFLDLLDVAAHTVVLVTHDVDEALRLADDIYVLSPRPGRIVDHIRVSDSTEVPRPADITTRQDFAMMKRRVLESLASGSR